MSRRSNCEDCIYYGYDEEYDSYYCEQELDEDEMVRFLERRNSECPLYRSGEADYFLSGRQ